ncbi:MAG: hypothetical protein A3E78_11325 [Alphaproteobacteria bacterium RIFCSPHIGHO2_12_FULL_63_12]|nr:MAG: hypothetical protein A3E78_11325 [Alphaproteobacteria bacterium RIFCSPHIGHO2_12_FULL_63_12]
MVALTLERAKPAELELKPPDPVPQTAPSPVWRTAGRPNALHGRIYKLLALFNFGILGVFWLTFQGDHEALFMVAISVGYLAAYMGAPFVLTRAGHVDPPYGKNFDTFLNSPIETWTGVVTGREAMVQILAVPFGLFLASIAFGLIIHHVS